MGWCGLGSGWKREHLSDRVFHHGFENDSPQQLVSFESPSREGLYEAE